MPGPNPSVGVDQWLIIPSEFLTSSAGVELIKGLKLTEIQGKPLKSNSSSV
jgi:hypothetical protein